MQKQLSALGAGIRAAALLSTRFQHRHGIDPWPSRIANAFAKMAAADRQAMAADRQTMADLTKAMTNLTKQLKDKDEELVKLKAALKNKKVPQQIRDGMDWRETMVVKMRAFRIKGEKSIGPSIWTRTRSLSRSWQESQGRARRSS